MNKLYLNGWSENNQIVLLYREYPEAKLQRERIDFEWYFLITDEDKRKLTDATWDEMIRREEIRRLQRDTVTDRYWRVYCDRRVKPLSVQRVFDRMDIPDLYDRWCRPLITPESCPAFSIPDNPNRWDQVHEVIDRLIRHRIEPLEADLTPLRRYLVDNQVRFAETYRVCYFDFETDDRGSLSEKENNRILAVAWEGDKAGTDQLDRGYLSIKHDSDAHERELLREMLKRFARYDVLVAWNGDGFDFPMMIARCRHLDLRINWRRWHFADLLPVFRKRFLRQQVKSYALDSIGKQVLGEPKMDWRKVFRERHPGVELKIYNLWKHDPELLREYNERDVSMLRRIDEATNFLNVERLQNRVAGIFANDFTVSAKIDTMMLKKGHQDGQHFRTRWWRQKTEDKYTGAYVFDPKVGLHRNVGTFDFKSLYPSMIRSFNISPETLVKSEARDKFKPEQLCTCPILEIDGEQRGGATYRVDREGYVGQMFQDTTERRNKYKKLMEDRIAEIGTKEDPKVRLYDNLAYAFKSLGLSFYGEMGHSTGRYYDVEMAESITLSGQFFIKKTEELAGQLGYSVIAGDTDSVFIQLIRDDEDIPERKRVPVMLERGKKLLEYCQSHYGDLLNSANCRKEWQTVQLEFEDVYDQILFCAKKRYAGHLIHTKGKSTDGLEYKGLEVMRSDYAELTTDMQRRVLVAILMENRGAEEIIRDIIEPERERCIGQQIDPEKLIISKSVSKDPSKYKTRSLHVRLAEWLQENTNEFYNGIKIGYIVTGASPKLDGVLADHFNPDKHKYDGEYYWDRTIYPASQRVLEACFPDIEWRQFICRRQRRRETLMVRYRKWIRDPKNRAKAGEQVKANKDQYLTPSDLEELRQLWKDTVDDIREAKKRQRTRAASRKGKKVQLLTGTAEVGECPGDLEHVGQGATTG